MRPLAAALVVFPFVAAAAGPFAPGQEAPAFAETRIDAGSNEFEHQLSDVDGDRRVDLVITTSTLGERSLQLWRQRADATWPQAPDFRMAVPPDVVSWSLVDVRPEPGKELVLLTRGGVFSLTTTQAGLQGNLRRELAIPLFPEIADPDRLPCWRLTKDVDGDGREELLVVSAAKLVALGVAPAADGGAPTLRPLLELDCSDEIEEDEAATVSIGGTGFNVRSRSGLQSLFPGARTSRPTFTGERLFAQRRGFKIPALIDWDGDRRLDSVRFQSRVVTVRKRLADGTFEASDTRYAFPTGDPPDSSGDRPPRAAARLVDCDGDGRDELFLDRDDGDGFGKSSVALIFPRGADGTPAETPTARVKLSGMDVDYELADVDRDGKLDLLARVIDIPTGLTTLATIRLDVAFYVFRGLPGGQVSREPEIRFERSFKPEQLARVQETLQARLDGDFDADGTCDLVSTQLDGRVEIRRVLAQGGPLRLEERPFASFVPASVVNRLETWELTDDVVSDLVLRHERGFTLFASRPRSSR